LRRSRNCSPAHERIHGAWPGGAAPALAEANSSRDSHTWVGTTTSLPFASWPGPLWYRGRAGSADGADWQGIELGADSAGALLVPYFRLFAPTVAYFDRSWPLPDIEKA